MATDYRVFVPTYTETTVEGEEPTRERIPDAWTRLGDATAGGPTQAATKVAESLGILLPEDAMVVPVRNTTLVRLEPRTGISAREIDA